MRCDLTSWSVHASPKIDCGPLLIGVSANTNEAEFRTCGFADVEFLSPEAIKSRYLAGRTDLPAPKHTTLVSVLI